MPENTQETKDFIKTYRNFLLERADRISTAVYLVTSILDTKEPLKWSLREDALKTLSSAQRGETEHLHNTLSDLMFGISLARKSVLISSMNADMLTQAIENFSQKIHTQSMFSEEFFQLPTGQTLPIAKDALMENKKEALIQEKETQATPQMQKTQQKSMGQKNVSKRQSASKGQVGSRKHKRREMILSALSKKKDQSIKDIAKQVRGCSEKTIQRELNSLIAKGKIVKHGERRWSTYALA